MFKKSRNHLAPTAPARICAVLGNVAADTKGHWLVLIGDRPSDDGDVLRYLRNLWPEADHDPASRSPATPKVP